MSDDYEALEKRRNLVRRMTAVSLAGKTLLVIDDGLNDWDLVAILNDLESELGEYAPSVFIVKPPDVVGRMPRIRNHHQIVTENLVHFLNRLLLEYRQIQHVDNAPSFAFNERWFLPAFFTAQKQASMLSSETRMIDAFLHHLLEGYSAHGDIGSLQTDAATAVSEMLREHPNYAALARI